MSSDNNDNNNNNTAASSSSSYQTIREGTVEMRYPADRERSVFYNPVQVQNRDLSLVMIALAAEDRAVRQAVERERVRSSRRRLDASDRKDALEAYRASLVPARELQRRQQSDDDDGLDVLDALAASGLRSLRYWKEIPGIRHVTINDLEAAAVARAHDNIRHNGVEHDVIPNKNKNDDDDDDESSRRRPAGICVRQGDALDVMYRDATTAGGRRRWDVIDLDPYGSAAPFLDAAVRAVSDGGLLCITCTDMAALGGSHPETCYGRYAAVPIQRVGYLHEAALRILLYAVATTAARCGRTVTPRLCVGMDFYVRCFVTVHDDRAGVARLSRRVGTVFQSARCASFVVVPETQMGGKRGTVYQAARAPGPCEETGGPYKMGGPLWLGPLHDADWLDRAIEKLTPADASDSKPDVRYLATRDRLHGLLLNCAEELSDAPLYYKISDMASLLRTSAPPLNDVRAALRNAGFRVSGYHKEPQAIKTDAPDHVVWDVLRAWCRRQQPPAKPPAEGTVGARILANPSRITVDFTHPPGGFPRRQRSDVARFPMNPQAGWGPKRAATGYKKKRKFAPEEPSASSRATASKETVEEEKEEEEEETNKEPRL